MHDHRKDRADKQNLDKSNGCHGREKQKGNHIKQACNTGLRTGHGKGKGSTDHIELVSLKNTRPCQQPENAHKQEISDKKTKIGEKGFIFLPYIIEGVCQTKIKEISK